MDEPGSTIQVSIRADAVEGWRAWRLVRRGDGSLGLGSLFSPEERWRPRSAVRAVCAVEGSYHPAPAVDCRCGYYAYADRARLAGASRRSGVVGAVSMWGSVVGHDFGYRAEYAYPQRLRLVCGPCLRIGRDRTPRWVVARRGELTAVCEWHTPRLRARASRARADAVQAGLLAAYAVEVLPPTGLSAPPLRRRVVRAIRSLLGTKTSIGWLLVAVLVASVAFNAASGSDGGTPKPLAVSSNGGEAPAIGSGPDIGAGLHHPSAGVVVRTACGVGRASRIEVVPCSQPHEWASTAIFHASVLPKCFGAVVETRPNGRSVCWVPIGSSRASS
jgi:hypothetical protein